MNQNKVAWLVPLLLDVQDNIVIKKIHLTISTRTLIDQCWIRYNLLDYANLPSEVLQQWYSWFNEFNCED